MATRFHHINFCSKNPLELESFYKDVLELGETFYDRIKGMPGVSPS